MNANVIDQTSATSSTDGAASGNSLFYLVTGGHCATAASCPQSGSECVTAVCISGDCGFQNVAAGTPTSSQTAGDCNVNECDGTGGTTPVADNSDLPDDGNVCTNDLCIGGVPSNQPLADGTTCNAGGGNRCESGSCVPSIVVVRVGDGSAALSASAAAVFLEERLPGSGSLASISPLPTAVNGSNQQCTLTGTATSEGGLSRSANGAYLQLAGYAAAVGTASVSSSTSFSINRVVCRIDAAGSIDTTSRMPSAFSTVNIRGAVSDDGSRFWVSGGSSGVVYLPLGMSGGTGLDPNPINIRQLGIFAGQLYGTSGSTPFTNVFTVGTGLPTVGGQSCTPLPGMPTSVASPSEFLFFDLNSNVAGPDTLYVADNRTIASGGGIQKWTFDGTTWTLTTTFNSGLTAGVFGVTGYVKPNGNVALFATTQESPSRLVSCVDDFVNLSPTITPLMTAGTNTVYRGVALAPH